MGPFLGAAAWIGWGAGLIRIVTRVGRRKGALEQHLLLILWITVFFLYQGAQWVKSMRYQLPIYPVDRAGCVAGHLSVGPGA